MTTRTYTVTAWEQCDECRGEGCAHCAGEGVQEVGQVSLLDALTDLGIIERLAVAERGVQVAIHDAKFAASGGIYD